MNNSNRRIFLSQLGILSGGLLFAGSEKGKTFEELGKSNLDWSEIRKQFPITQNDIVQLNSGSAGTMPFPVLKKLNQLIVQMNTMPPYEAFLKWQEERNQSKERLAEKLGVSSDELAYVRNTTEALNNVIFGYPLIAGDEIICASCDYPFPINAIKQRAERDGISKVELELDLLNLNKDEIIDAYRKAISSKTKLILLTHITHREGQIMPVKEICKIAHQNGVEVLLDAAHSFAHIEHSISDLGCDFYGTSLHKWLNAPHGLGLLYVNKQKISKIYPLSSADEKEKENIIKFEYIGTRSFAHELGVGASLDFLELSGIQKKQEHLHSLKSYWVNKVKHLSKIKIYTNASPDKSCALASFDINCSLSAGEIKNIFEKDHKLHIKTTAYKGKRSFLRVTPNIFTSTDELDRLVYAIKSTAENY